MLVACTSDGFWDNVTDDDVRKFLQRNPVARQHMDEAAKAAALSPGPRAGSRSTARLGCCSGSSRITMDDVRSTTDNDATALARALLIFSVSRAADQALQDNVSVIVVLFGAGGGPDGESKASAGAGAGAPAAAATGDERGWEDVWWNPVATVSALQGATRHTCSRLRRVYDGVTGVSVPCDADASGVASP